MGARGRTPTQQKSLAVDVVAALNVLDRRARPRELVRRLRLAVHHTHGRVMRSQQDLDLEILSQNGYGHV